MRYCENCGSTSHDDSGFCRGCGMRLPGAPDPSASGSTPRGSANVAKDPMQTLASMPLAQPKVKIVWVAVLLALLLGPLGMIYSTVAGALVMFAASLFALLFLGKAGVWISLLLLPVVCAVWAGVAARSANSMY